MVAGFFLSFDSGVELKEGGGGFAYPFDQQGEAVTGSW